MQDWSSLLLPLVPVPLSALVQKTQAKKGGKAKKTSLRYVIDFSTPVEDEIMDAGAFVSEVVYACVSM